MRACLTRSRGSFGFFGSVALTNEARSPGQGGTVRPQQRLRWGGGGEGKGEGGTAAAAPVFFMSTTVSIHSSIAYSAPSKALATPAAAPGKPSAARKRPSSASAR